MSATNQTVGQLKFLFRCEMAAGEEPAPKQESKTDMHVESSVKFFLLHPLSQQQAVVDGADAVVLQEQVTCFPLEQFVGPHLGENLAWRVQEVARKLDMCRGDSVRSWLSAKYSEHVSSHIALRGYLFYPLRLFASTSSVTRAHDWRHHRNTTIVSTPYTCGSDMSQTSDTGSLPPSHPGIAPDHLSGWWTSDFETEVPAKVAANDPAQCGESRFVVLPKLHWLSPVIATEEAQSGNVFVGGEQDLGADRVETMTLSELVVFAKAHFENLVAVPPEAQARGAVVMPLLVAEIIRCRPVDQEFSASIVRWKELSRGFILDPRCWDPIPLCSEPVRFRKISQRVDSSALGNSIEREYTGRKEWRHDGVVKPTEQELASRHEKRPRVFPDPESVSPSDLVTGLAAALGREQKDVTHATLKSSIKEVLLYRLEDGGEPDGGASGSPRTIAAVGDYVREALSSLVFELPPLDGENTSNHTQRVGHLILDEFEGIVSSSTRSVREVIPEDDPGDWISLFLRVAADRSRWDFLNLVLRALQLIRVSDASTVRTTSAFDPSAKLDATIECLLSQEQCRWNAVAVETISVFFSSGEDPATWRRTRALFHRLVDQGDWPNAERLTVVTRDPVLFQAIFEEFARWNMTKAMKRLRKAGIACLGGTDASSSQVLCSTTHSGGPNVLPARATGPAIDHIRNREIAGLDLALKHWEYVCSPAQLQDVVGYLTSLERAVQTQPDQGDRAKKTIVGLDCEWRPQFLRNAWRPSTATDGDEDNDAKTVKNSNAGVSVYQLAVGDRVFVIDVQVLGVMAAAPLEVIWRRSSPFLLVGFCVSSDLKRLAQSFPELTAASTDPETEIRLMELKRFAAFRHVPVDKWGLSRLYFACFDREVNKEQQCSDWGSRPLTSSQLAYAAMDAHTVRNVALHLLADMKLKGDEVAGFMRQFSAAIPGHNPSALSHWRSDLQTLGKPHVHAALRDLGLESVVGFHAIAKDLWSQNPHHENGLVVKTIAIVVKRAPSDGKSTAMVSKYAVVVLQLDRIIDMEALAACVGTSSPDEVSLADQQTLVRVFGYSRGCVGPIGLRQQAAIQVIVDERLEREHRLLCGAGALDEVYSIAPDVLIATVSATTADISASVD